MIGWTMIVLLEDERLEIPTKYYKEYIHGYFGNNTMVFFPEELYGLLNDSDKKYVGEIGNDYSVDQMLKMDLLTILTNNEFDKETFKRMVNKVKGKPHYFAEVLGV